MEWALLCVRSYTKVTPAHNRYQVLKAIEHISSSYNIQYQGSWSADSSSYLLLGTLPSKNMSQSSPFSQRVRKKNVKEAHLGFRHFSLEMKQTLLWFTFYWQELVIGSYPDAREAGKCSFSWEATSQPLL